MFAIGLRPVTWFPFESFTTTSSVTMRVKVLMTGPPSSEKELEPLCCAGSVGKVCPVRGSVIRKFVVGSCRNNYYKVP